MGDEKGARWRVTWLERLRTVPMNGKSTSKSTQSFSLDLENSIDPVSGLGEYKRFVLHALIEEPDYDPSRWVTALSL